MSFLSKLKAWWASAAGRAALSAIGSGLLSILAGFLTHATAFPAAVGALAFLIVITFFPGKSKVATDAETAAEDTVVAVEERTPAAVGKVLADAGTLVSDLTAPTVSPSVAPVAATTAAKS